MNLIHRIIQKTPSRLQPWLQNMLQNGRKKNTTNKKNDMYIDMYVLFWRLIWRHFWKVVRFRFLIDHCIMHGIMRCIYFTFTQHQHLGLQTFGVFRFVWCFICMFVWLFTLETIVNHSHSSLIPWLIHVNISLYYFYC